jgi:hypothetical protein
LSAGFVAVALEPRRSVSNIKIMETRVVLALAVGLVLGIRADGRAETGPPGDNPDGGPLVATPGSSTGAPTNAQAETAPWPQPSLDSKRAPVPDRLALPWDMQDVPLAPPPPIPNNGGTNNQTGSGANHTSKIFKRTSGGADSDVPRDSVTRTPEDQLAPPTYPAQGPR